MGSNDREYLPHSGAIVVWRRIARISFLLVACILGLVLLALIPLTIVLRSSLPRLEGECRLVGLQQVVSVTRDSLGVPEIEAQNRMDAARALGFLHAQDRFFQMDLLRRSAAGELSALLGPALLPTDHSLRRHRFRERAKLLVSRCHGRNHQILLAYTEGVNEGLTALRARPFEYLLLRQKPKPWRPEDTYLTLYAMFLDLGLSGAHAEETYESVREMLPPALATMLLPRGNRWDAPLERGEMEGVVLPGASQVDLRHDQRYETSNGPMEEPAPPEPAGSNNWAVAGSLTGHGGALLANDMHLGHALPNIWYRALMSWPEGGGVRSVVGVTLPGAPALVAGSNGDVAWGFTNSQGDWCDLVRVDLAADDSSLYRTPTGWRHLQPFAERFEVAGAEADTNWVDETIWGPIWTHDDEGRPLALHWTAYDTSAVNLKLMDLESVTSVDSVVAMGAYLGIPEQNLVCADRNGRIAWTLAGAIPERIGFSGRFPRSWADGSCRWEGYCDAQTQPKLLDPPEGRLWTANNRVTVGKDLDRIGNGGYALGARATQIRDDLRALNHPVEKDMLAIQLDDRADFMGQWRELFLGVLQRTHPGLNEPRAEFARIVRDNWSGRADTESVAYRLVRETTERCVAEIYAMLTAPCREANPNFRSSWLPFRHAVCWKLLKEQPSNLLTDRYASWDALALTAIDHVIEEAVADGRALEDYRWGERNMVDIAHPFCRLFPWLRRWLSLPRRALPGDSWMPRVQHPRRGASERLVVSPGREEQGIFEMPGGQSGHPLSPFFRAGTRAWEEGKATPLLPGPAKYRLVLRPPQLEDRD